MPRFLKSAFTFCFFANAQDSDLVSSDVVGVFGLSWPSTVRAAICTGLLGCVAMPVSAVDKPTVTFTASPQVSLWNPRGATVTLRLTVHNADEKLWCPEVRWEFADGTAATEVSDCVPYETTNVKDREWQTWTRRALLGSGRYEFVVKLQKSGRTIRSLTSRAWVTGNDN